MATATKTTEAQMEDPKPFAVEATTGDLTAAAKVEAAARKDNLLGVMRAKYAAEPRVRVKVKNDGPVPVQVNGYTFVIRENVWVEVPESIADILDEAGYI